MFIFIEESGVHKAVDHSTFVLVYVEIDNYDQIECQIKAVEKKLKVDYFHWAHTVWKVKAELR